MNRRTFRLGGPCGAAARRSRLRAACLWLPFVAAGCGAVYPELSSPVRPVLAYRELKPPPPTSLLYIVFTGAEIPERTRDGRKWDRMGGAAPDPFAKILVNDRQLVMTPVQANTLTPTWPDQKRANYYIPKGAKVEIQLWDSNPIHNHPICVKNVRNIHNEVTVGSLDIACDSGARVTLSILPARAKLGLGLYYELRTVDIVATRVIRESPAARVGIKRGDQIVKIQGKEVREMEDGEARSLINTNSRSGLTLTVKHADGRIEDLTLKEGPIYPAVDEDIPVDG